MGQRGESTVQIAEGLVQWAQVAFCIKRIYAQCFQLSRGLVRWSGQGKDHVAEGRAAFRTLDTVVCEDAQSHTQLCRAAGQVLCGAAYREDRIAKLLDAGVGLGARRRHLIYKVSGFSHRQPKRRLGVRHHVRCRCQIDAASRCQIQHVWQHGHGLLGIIAGQSHVIQSVSRFGGGERGVCAHLLRKLSKLAEVLARLRGGIV